MGVFFVSLCIWKGVLVSFIAGMFFVLSSLSKKKKQFIFIQWVLFGSFVEAHYDTDDNHSLSEPIFVTGPVVLNLTRSQLADIVTVNLYLLYGIGKQSWDSLCSHYINSFTKDKNPLFPAFIGK